MSEEQIKDYMSQYGLSERVARELIAKSESFDKEFHELAQELKAKLSEEIRRRDQLKKAEKIGK